MGSLIRKLSFIATAGASIGLSAQGWLGIHGSEGCLEIGASALWQQSCISDYTYAADINNIQGRFVNGAPPANVQITPKAVKPHFDWGFGVFVEWRDACWLATARYKHLWSNRHSRSVTGIDPVNGSLVIANGIFGSGDAIGARFTYLGLYTHVIARQTSRFDSVSLRFGRNLFCSRCARFYSYAGGRYVGAEIRRRVQGTAGNNALLSPTIIVPGLVNFTTERTRFDGGGIELGVGSRYSLWHCLNVIAVFGPAAIIGNRSDALSLFGGRGRDASTVNNGSQIIYPARNITKCVIGLDGRVGVNYTYDFCLCGCQFGLTGEAGWEVEYYWNIVALRPATFNQLRLPPVEAEADATNFGLNGLYLSLALRF